MYFFFSALLQSFFVLFFFLSALLQSESTVSEVHPALSVRSHGRGSSCGHHIGHPGVGHVWYGGSEGMALLPACSRLVSLLP